MTEIINHKKGRIAYVDFMKALGMLTIIWGHIMLSGITNSMVYAFHIPLFFFLSGLMFRSSKYPSFVGFIKNRVHSLLIPYVVFSFLTWCVWAGYSYISHAEVDSYIMPLMQTFIAQGSGGFLVHNVPLWFVTCLFVVECLYFFIAKLPTCSKIVVCIVCGIVGSWMSLDHSFFNFRLLPWNIEVAFAAIPFYAIGNLMIEHFTHKEIINIVTDNKMRSIAAFMLSSALLWLGAYVNGSVSMGSNHLNIFFVFYGAAVCGIVMMLILCIWLSTMRNNYFWKFMEWFGKNSYTSMVIHNPIKGIVVVIVSKYLMNISDFYEAECTTICYIPIDYIFSIIAFILSLAITCIGIVFINFMKQKI